MHRIENERIRSFGASSCFWLYQATEVFEIRKDALLFRFLWIAKYLTRCYFRYSPCVSSFHIIFCLVLCDRLQQHSSNHAVVFQRPRMSPKVSYWFIPLGAPSWLHAEKDGRAYPFNRNSFKAQLFIHHVTSCHLIVQSLWVIGRRPILLSEIHQICVCYVNSIISWTVSRRDCQTHSKAWLSILFTSIIALLQHNRKVQSAVWSIFQSNCTNHRQVRSWTQFLSYTKFNAERKHMTKIGSRWIIFGQLYLYLWTVGQISNPSTDFIVLEGRLIIQAERPVVQRFLEAVTREGNDQPFLVFA